ncbi:hypothetical protein AM501_09770 [Aneurinibacillus migulanus]|uniref:DUF5677 domain-containing protein n=1 Tax=Aneurinibacillus migulanus TaxID=47500 RepID=UPI0005B8FE60|nr:DUF5677 domain-containing protein [Aneurinibacillus migulanus]KIV56433.1 hypothetical protein TS64_09185 [Aneurinibacillus migulanus]KPD08441.1 hypothetical protein AM501_09770 [Aneurinibacillus migulanus]
MRPYLDLETQGKLITLEKVIQYGDALTTEILQHLSRSRSAPDNQIIHILLFRKIIEKLDGAFILMNSGSENNATSILRNALENLMYFMYIQKEDTEHRCLYYYVGTLVYELSYYRMLLPESIKYKHIKHLIKSTSPLAKKQWVEEKIRALEQELEGPELRAIYNE